MEPYFIVEFQYVNISFFCLWQGGSDSDNDPDSFVVVAGDLLFTSNLDGIQRYCDDNGLLFMDDIFTFDVEIFRSWANGSTKTVDDTMIIDFWNIIDDFAYSCGVIYFGSSSDVSGIYKKLDGKYNKWEERGYFRKDWTDWGIAAVKRIILEGISILDSVFMTH